PYNIGLATSIYIASNAMGGLSGRVTTGYLTDVYSWKISLLSLATFGLVVTVCFYLLLPASRFFNGGSRSMIHDMKGMFVHLK
ncbi:MFS transporter, partial [Staphylococcus sp. SIMBA_130]